MHSPIVLLRSVPGVTGLHGDQTRVKPRLKTNVEPTWNRAANPYQAIPIHSICTMLATPMAAIRRPWEARTTGTLSHAGMIQARVLFNPQVIKAIEARLELSTTRTSSYDRSWYFTPRIHKSGYGMRRDAPTANAATPTD